MQRWEEFRASFYIEPESGCWLWTRGVNNDGYGHLHWRGRTALAHRVAYELLASPIPAGLQLDHTCRVRNCVNPAHLEPVTPRENVLRGNGFAAVAARKTHCPHEHPYSPANTYVTPSGARRCRTCMRAARRRRNERSSTCT